MQKYITIIIPCFNYKKLIRKKYKEFLHILKIQKITSYQIILIDDGSFDKTYKVINNIKNNKTLVLRNRVNLGKSASIINSLKLVNSKYVMLIDCDLPYLNSLKKVMYSIKFNDLVILNRKRKLQFYSLYHFFRSLIGYYLGKITESILDLNVNGDTQSGLKVFKFRKELKREIFISKYFFFDIELIHFFKRNKLKIKKININEETIKNSTINFINIKKNILIIFEYLKVMRLLKKL